MTKPPLLTFAEAEAIGHEVHDRFVANGLVPPMEVNDRGWGDIVQFVMRRSADVVALRTLTVITGGRKEARELSPGFEHDVERALGEYVRFDEENARTLWQALTNIAWRRADGSQPAIHYSFRAAGDLVASIRGEGNYMDWYCCARPGCVAPEVEREMAALGWTFGPSE